MNELFKDIITGSARQMGLLFLFDLLTERVRVCLTDPTVCNSKSLGLLFTRLLYNKVCFAFSFFSRFSPASCYNLCFLSIDRILPTALVKIWICITLAVNFLWSLISCCRSFLTGLVRFYCLLLSLSFLDFFRLFPPFLSASIKMPTFEYEFLADELKDGISVFHKDSQITQISAFVNNFLKDGKSVAERKERFVRFSSLFPPKNSL
jgi:hypothetical protein